MYLIVTSNCKVLVNHERLFDEKKSYLINSSRLNELWQKNYMEPSLDRVKFLYIGRMNPEKGIFQFIEMLKKIKFNFEFSIVGDNKNKKKSEKNIKYLGYVANEELLIKIYDNHNIFIKTSPCLISSTCDSINSKFSNLGIPIGLVFIIICLFVVFIFLIFLSNFKSLLLDYLL